MEVLTEDFKKHIIWVELTEDNVTFCIRLMAHQMRLRLRGRRYSRGDAADGSQPSEIEPARAPAGIDDEMNDSNNGSDDGGDASAE